MTAEQRQALDALTAEGPCESELAPSGLLRVVLGGRELVLVEPGGKIARGLDPLTGSRLRHPQQRG